MSKKKDKAETFLKPEVSKELDKIKLGKEKTHKIEKGSWPREEKILEQLQRARIKEIQRKILKDEDYNKQKKAYKKIGGVRGKFHPSLERTRKRT
jgi:ribosomal protein L11